MLKKQKVRKILVFPLGGMNIPSSRLRILCYQKMFEKSGIKFIVFNEKQVTKNAKLINLFHFITADILLVQKQIFTGKKQFVSKLLRKKIAFDLDDAIYVEQESGKINHESLNELLNFVKICKLVVVGNTYLGETLLPYSQKQLHLITLPSTTPGSYPHTARQPIRIGWIGTRNNLPYLEGLNDILLKLQRKYQIEIVVICSDKPTSFEELKYKFIEWTLDIDEKLSHYFDIGIMPLPDNKWTKGKCGYKILQYYSFGLPVIASPVGINKELIIPHKTGFLANTPQEWHDYLEFFITEPNNISKMSAKIIKHYSNNYSSEKQFQMLLKELNKL